MGALAVDFTDSLSLGRYAFRTSVRNPWETPVPNVWILRSYSEGVLLEEGAASGYEVVSASLYSPSPPAYGWVPSTAHRALDGFTALLMANMALLHVVVGR